MRKTRLAMRHPRDTCMRLKLGKVAWRGRRRGAGWGGRGVGLVGDKDFPFIFRLAEGEGLSYPFEMVSIMRGKGMASESTLGLHIPVFTVSLIFGECK